MKIAHFAAMLLLFAAGLLAAEIAKKLAPAAVCRWGVSDVFLAAAITT